MTASNLNSYKCILYRSGNATKIRLHPYIHICTWCMKKMEKKWLFNVCDCNNEVCRCCCGRHRRQQTIAFFVLFLLFGLVKCCCCCFRVPFACRHIHIVSNCCQYGGDCLSHRHHNSVLFFRFFSVCTRTKYKKKITIYHIHKHIISIADSAY